MGIFKNGLHNDFGTWPLAYIPYGGADYGEIEAVGLAIGDGDDGAYYTAWNEAADRMSAEADAVLAKGHRESAKELYLRESVFRATSYHPLYGAQRDPRLIETSRKQTAAFDKAMALSDPPIVRQQIPYTGRSLPAYFVPAAGAEHEVRPLIILTNGYDATITDLYFLSAVAASRRGYHSLLFDGPGQGAMLVEHGLPMRPDWETVITAVVDFAVAHPLVDPKRIALNGASLGGYLAPRGASGEHRIAALIADPANWSIAGGFRSFAVKMLGVPPAEAEDLGALDQSVLDRMEQIVAQNRDLYWKVVQRGYWVHGVDSLRDYLREAELFTMRGRAELIRCPTLLIVPENDPIAADADKFMETLRCEKTLLRFTAAEGAGSHCEMGNRSLLNRRVLDWLDERFA